VKQKGEKQSHLTSSGLGGCLGLFAYTQLSSLRANSLNRKEGSFEGRGELTFVFPFNDKFHRKKNMPVTVTHLFCLKPTQMGS
jgi:hypothetical protein